MTFPTIDGFGIRSYQRVSPFFDKACYDEVGQRKYQGVLITMNSAFQAMYTLLQSDPRFKFEAYQFVREALAYAHEQMLAAAQLPTKSADAKSTDDDRGGFTGHHITGQQLCEACRHYGLQQYGYLTAMVLASWGVRSTSDFGEIVYNLISIEQMRKSDSDQREDFDEVYSFDTAFQPQFDLMTSESTSS